MSDKPTRLTLDRLFTTKDFDKKPFGPARWLEDDLGYTTLEPAEDDEKIKEIIRYDIQTGDRHILVSRDLLQVDGQEKPLVIEDYHWSDDKKHLLIFTNGQRVWRQNTRGDYWHLNLESGHLKQIGRDEQKKSLMFAKFSPDNRSIAYLSQNNLYVQALGSYSIRQLTDDGAKHIINGTADWVYEEEFHLRDGFAWSPDSQSIAYWQFNTEAIKTFYMINNTDSLYPELIPIPYPKAGTQNSDCRIGVVPAAGGSTTWMDVPEEANDYYLPRMEWAAGSDELVIQQFNRLQNRNRVLLVDRVSGESKTILLEEDEAWIDAHRDLKWLEDGRSFIWISDRDGWRHAYRVSRDGREVTLLTPGDFDIVSIQKVDEAGNLIYFIASPDNPGQRYLFNAGLDGSGNVRRLSPEDQPGYHSYQVSKTGKYAFHTYSNKNQPPVISLISLPDHQRIRTLENNQDLRQVVAEIALPQTEFFRIDPGDGTLLDGWCIKPADFDPSRQYPTLFFVYGEPAGQTVIDVFPDKAGLWHHMLAQRGYLIISIDNKGTPAPRGRSWRKQVYRQVGIMTTDSQAAAAQAIIRQWPYIDHRRIAVWGWSGGGTMTLNLMFKYPDIYKTGIAIAAVSDLRYYDTIYQERYQGLPDDNEEGYKNGSPIHFAGRLEGNLMIIHGTADDNVHYQCHEALVNELIKQNKQFSMMSYPNRTHSVKEGKNTRHHLYTTMTRFLEENL